MKRKVLLVILFLTLTIFLSGCFLFNRLSADVVVEDWKQNYDDNSVKVWFRIHNTGNVIIGCYTIRFTAYCKDGSTYENCYNDFFRVNPYFSVKLRYHQFLPGLDSFFYLFNLS